MNESIFNAFDKWIGQRSGLDFANYGDRVAFMEDSRRISKQRAQARRALAQARAFEFDADAMQKAFSAFSGRLQWKDDYFDYCTGQYFPTEFAIAAATVLEAYIDAVRPKHVPAPNQPFSTIADIKAASYAAGSHWFDKSSMRFFRSRIVPKVYSGPGGIYFVSSETSGSENGRRFTVRQFDPLTADVSSFGPFNEMSKERAQRIARIAAQDRKVAEEALAAGKVNV